MDQSLILNTLKFLSERDAFSRFTLLGPIPYKFPIIPFPSFMKMLPFYLLPTMNTDVNPANLLLENPSLNSLKSKLKSCLWLEDLELIHKGKKIQITCMHMNVFKEKDGLASGLCVIMLANLISL